MITVEPGKYQTHASVDAATLAADIARRCKQAKFHPSRMEWSACCPCHDDRHPSLSITWNDEGVGLHCHAGCKTADIVHALGLTLADLFVRADHYSNGHGRPVEVYDYVNEAGYVVHQTLRYPNKYFPQRRPDPAQPGKYIDNLRGIDPILYHLPDVLAALKRGQAIYITEGEKDANTVTKLGLTATTNPMGAGKWDDRYSETLTGADCVLLPDNDKAGREHMVQVAASLQGKAASVRLLELPALPEKGDVSDWVAAGGTREQLVRLAQQTPVWAPAQRPPTCWDKAVPVGEFLAQQDVEYEAYIRDFVVPGAITIVAAPRGTGKSITALAMGIALANGGRFRQDAIIRRRVLVIDRDNPAKIVRARLRKLGAKAGSTLDILTRENAPPLSEKAAWASFPIEKYDVVIIDSLGSSTEGISEREGKQTQEFLATLKDLAHRGPAVLALDNTNKAATSYRGRGEKADAVDILFEARDITGWTPPADTDWWEHLPEYGDHTWQSRASRRQGQAVLRLAFIPSKYRLGIEPSPFALEIDTRTDPWTLADITGTLATQGQEAAREHRETERANMEKAVNALVAALSKRAPDTPMLKTAAGNFLQGQGLSRRQARTLLEDTYNADVYPSDGLWRLVPQEQVKHNPIVVILVGEE